MATLELEPDFVKGLRYMLSSSRESVESLRCMLDDAIRTKYGSSKSLGSFQHKLKLDEEYTSQILTERNSEDSSSSKEDVEGELNLDMMEEDLACTVCRGINVGPRNRLVECCECHSLYHQECHRPVIAEQDISDPRNTWYCSACSRSIHKPTETATSSTGSSKQSSSSSKSSSSKQTFKSSGSSRDSPTNPKSSSRSEASSEKSSLFKRTDKVSSGSSSNNSSKAAPAGLAALAASLQPSKSSSSSGSSSHKSSSSGFTSSSTSSSKSSSSSKDNYSSSSKAFSSSGGSSGQSSKGAPSSPTLSGINADRRLQIMKKKAAKLQEKRKHSK